MTVRKLANSIVSTEPADPRRVVAHVPAAVVSDVERAIDRAGSVGPEWLLDPTARGQALLRWADRITRDAGSLADLISHEVGKPIRESRAEVSRAESILRYYAHAIYEPLAEVLPGGDRRTRVIIERHPIGVVGAICPWNFPLAIPIWKLAPALAFGNTVLFKPASSAVAVGQRLTELARPDIGPGILAYLPTRGPGLDRLVDDDRVEAISFTGSSEVGRTLVGRIASRGGRVQAEMGGQNASIVLSHADLDHAAATITSAAMGYAGQKCTATSRIVVMRDVASEMIDRLVTLVDGLVVGDPLDELTDVGPLIDESARDAVRRSIAGARARGGRLLTRMRAHSDAHASVGWYHPPTLVAMDDPGDPFVQEETFGPVASIMTVSSEDEAVRLANGTRYGLSAAVFGTDQSATTDVAGRLRAGMVRINGATTGADFWAPFGGERASSYGSREQGREAREFYTKSRTRTVHWSS